MDNKKKRKKRNFNNKKTTKDYRPKFKPMDDYDSYEGDRATNDPNWYAQYPELMRDSASLPYSIPTGGKMSWNVNVDPANPLVVNGTLTQAVYAAIPGIMTLGIVPTAGLSIDATSPINVASDMLYTKVRAENSGARNYDSPDLMLYCLAMDQVYSLLTWFNRIYGTMMLYSQVNRYLPKALLNAQWIDFDDMIIHINDFKAFLDTATAQAAVFSVPADMKLFNRHAFMYQNVYKDAESAKSQLYQFAPRVFYYYDELNGPGKLVPYDVIISNPNLCKFSDLVTMFHTLMDPIIASEDFNIMSGDILKAFGEGNLIRLQIMPSGYTIIPITDYEVLTQIKNATVSNIMLTAAATGWSAGRADWTIHQDANADYIEFNPVLRTVLNTQPPYYYTQDLLLSTYKTNPEPADNMVYSRLMWTAKDIDDGTNINTTFSAVGSEFVSSCAVSQFHFDANGDWKCDTVNLDPISNANVYSLSSTARYARLFYTKHFDFCPAMYMFDGGGGKTYFYPIFDVDNWTIVHAYELEKMHRTAVMSMLRVPMIGSALPSSR